MLDNTTVGERFKKVRTESGLSQDNFAKKLGVSRSLVAMIERNDTKPNLDVLAKTVRLFNISYEYLIEGAEVNREYKYLEKEQQLTSVVKEPAIIEYNIEGKEDFRMIPITSIKAAAGTGIINSSDLSSDDFIHVPDNFLKSGNHICVQIRGESMSPTFLDSDYAIIRQIEPSEWRFIPDQYVYVIADKEGGTYFKRVKNRFTEHGFVTCMSDNIDKANYPNFNLNEDEILSIWIFEMKFSFKAPNINDNYYQKVSHIEDSIEMITRHLDSIEKRLK